jgi:hypothetical protein
MANKHNIGVDKFYMDDKKKYFSKDLIYWLLVYLFAYAMQLLVFGPIGSTSDMAGFAYVYGLLTAAVVTIVMAAIYYTAHFVINIFKKKK